MQLCQHIKLNKFKKKHTKITQRKIWQNTWTNKIFVVVIIPVSGLTVGVSGRNKHFLSQTTTNKQTSHKDQMMLNFKGNLIFIVTFWYHNNMSLYSNTLNSYICIRYGTKQS